MDYRSAVDQTLAYSANFSFPLSPEEVHLWLISSQKVPFSQIRSWIPRSTLKDNQKRHQLRKYTSEKEPLILQFINAIRWFPGISMVALTGSVAIGNTQKKDDLDLLIVTKPYLLWIVRPFFLLFLEFRFHRRHPGDNLREIPSNSFCPNLWLDSCSLGLPQDKRNLYTAHEVLQARPILDRGDTYQAFLHANYWSSRYLANAYHTKTRPTPKATVKTTPLYFLFAPLDLFLFFLQYLYMLPKITTESVSLHSAFFHKKDPQMFLHQYLRKYSL